MVPLHEILQLSMICWPLRRGLMTSSFCLRIGCCSCCYTILVCVFPFLSPFIYAVGIVAMTVLITP